MHIAFVSPAGYGHVNPTLPLVRALVDRGHRVTYATGASLAPATEAAGARALPLPTELPTDPRRLIDFSADGLAYMLGHWLEGGRADLPLLVEHFTQDSPDAVCYDVSSFVGQILAGRLGVPGITLSPTFAGHETFSYTGLLLPPDFALTDELARFTADVHALSAEFGVATDPTQAALGLPTALNLVFLPREFQLRGDTFDDRFRFIGPTPAEGTWRPPKARRVLYVTLGTLFNDRPGFFGTCAKAFAGTDWHVVIALGSRVAAADLGPLPPNVETGAYLPQSAILRHAAVSVSHAGMTTTMDSLYFGVPMVTVPDTPEQGLNADRVAELGLGRRLPGPDVSPAELRRVVEEVAADTGVRQRTAWLRDRIHACGGAAAGADEIEKHLLRSV